MVHKYKSKGARRGSYDEKKLSEAVSMVQRGTLSARQASTRFGIPRSTLEDYVRGNSLPGCSIGRPPALEARLERGIVEKAQGAAARDLVLFS